MFLPQPKLHTSGVWRCLEGLIFYSTIYHWLPITNSSSRVITQTSKSASIIRGVPGTNLVRHLGKLFKQCQGDASDYELSRDVQDIDVFISHSWRAPWRSKVLAIQWYLHRRLAVTLGTAAVALGAAATLLLPWDRVPHWHFTAIDGARWEYGLTMYLGVLGFFAGLGAAARLRRDARHFFLDKCCIHQTDIVKQHDGIAGLGQLILRSRRLVIFWDRSYFTRLWCVYELAMFLGSGNHAGKDVDFAPIFVPRAVLTIFFQGLLSYLALDVFSGLGIDAALRGKFPNHDPEATFMVFYILIHLLTAGLLMQQLVEFQVDRAEMWRQLEGFSVENARLTDESDRPRIYADIEKKWADDAGENALRNFDAHVRRVVAREVRASVGASSAIPYPSLMLAFLPHAWRGVDTALGPEPPARRLHGLLFLTTLACLAYPLLFCVPLRFAHWAADKERPSARRLLTLIGAVVTGMSVPVGCVLWAMLFFAGIPGASHAYDVGVTGSACLVLTVLATALAVRSLYTGKTMDRVVFRRFDSAPIPSSRTKSD